MTTQSEKEPTQEQLQKFWEWCGVKKDVLPWSFHYGGDYPPVDLNNLFKYAVPKLQKEFRNWKSVLLDWLDELKVGQDPALALFWAIWEVIK